MTVSFYPTGGLGNLIFIHNAAYTLSKENGDGSVSTFGYYSGSSTERPCMREYGNIFKHVKFVDGLMAPDFIEHGNDLTYNEIPKTSKCIQGYFQSWRYFEKYRIEIRDLFRNNDVEKWNAQVERYKTIKKSGQRTVCLHVRLGDMIVNPVHMCMDENYYKNAMKKFKGQKFLLFSDSPDIAKTMNFEETNIEYIDETDPVSAFFLMSLCDDFIIPNSTLSLMSYHMRENTDDACILYTEHWHKNDCIKLDMKDMIKDIPNMREVLMDNGIPFNNGKIHVEKPIKIDVGLKCSATVSQNLLKNSDCVVFGFEPNPTALKALKAKDKSYAFSNHFLPDIHEHINTDYICDRFYIVPVALDDIEFPDYKTFYVVPKSEHAGEDCSSLLKPLEEFCKNPIEIKVPCYPLKHFMELLPFESVVEFIKVDVQGKDTDVIKSAGDYVKKIIFITAETQETPQYENENQINSIEILTEYLKSKNFVREFHPLTRDPTFYNKLYENERKNIYIFQFN